MIDLGLGIGGTAKPAQHLAPPDGFAFPFNHFPLRVFASGRTDFEPAAYARDALNGTLFHVDPSTGNDGNSGLSTAARLQSVHVAITRGNATGAPYAVLVRNLGGAIVPRAHGISSSGAVRPTQKCAIVMESGPVAFATHDLLAYTADPVMAGVFGASRSNVARVFDLRGTDAFGNPVELVRVGSEAALAGDPGATGLWYNSGASFKVKLHDGAVASNDTVLALLLTQNVSLNGASQDFFLDGAKLYGGNDGGLHASGVVGNVVCHKVEARLAGAAGALRDGFRIESVRGLAAFQHCRAAGNAKDGFNAHRLAGLPDSLFVLTDRCKGADNGRYTAQSCNFVTAHEDVVWLDVGGRAEANHGAQVHLIDQAQLWAVATESRHSRGDLALGGGIPPTEFLTEDSALMWLENTLAEAASGSGWAVRARGVSTILKRRHRTLAGQEGADGTAVIGGF
jgi:hypothetical protein